MYKTLAQVSSSNACINTTPSDEPRKSIAEETKETGITTNTSSIIDDTIMSTVTSTTDKSNDITETTKNNSTLNKNITETSKDYANNDRRLSDSKKDNLNPDNKMA